MAKTKVGKLGSAKRFGARYGTKTKHKFAKIEKEQRKRHRCPYCNNVKVKRVAVGIWHCKKCNARFTGKAYSVAKPIIFEEEVQEEKMPEKIESGKNELEKTDSEKTEEEAA